MIRKMILIIVMMGLCSQVKAGQFKAIDFNHVQVVTGVFTDLKGHSDGGSSLALITYKGVVDVTPLAIGGTIGSGLGGPSIGVGTSINLLPNVKAAFLNVLKALYSNPAKFSNIKTILSPAAPGLPDITMSVGPHASYVFTNGIHGKMMLTLFYGAKWAF